jgi:hypothetical protein
LESHTKIRNWQLVMAGGFLKPEVHDAFSSATEDFLADYKQQGVKPEKSRIQQAGA